ncbi:MAG TPA: hypothetical protein VFS65_01340 [Candidatus Saccharimonadales bacterium]|nr:hypothetical protein [Candidatus Saccharimonadales bacterium]
MSERSSTSIESLAHQRQAEARMIAMGCDAVLGNDLIVPDNVRTVILEKHINTLQRMWLPPDYTDDYVSVHKQVEDLYAHNRANEANDLLRDFDEFLQSDPLALKIRHDATKGIRSALSSNNTSEFDRITGFKPEFNEVVKTRYEEIRMKVGQYVSGKVVQLKSSFAE